MRVAVVGSRCYSGQQDYEFLVTVMRLYNRPHIVSGGAAGVDTMAFRYAREHGLPITVHFPDWEGDGRSAGYKRNRILVEDCEEMVALWDGTSKGTADAIGRAREHGRTVRIFTKASGSWREEVR